jgi:hypothetical protein
MWQSKLPLKVRNLIWLVYQQRLQTIDNLSRKHWKGSKLCQLFNEEETKDHLLFRCPPAVFLWRVIRDGLHRTNTPTSIKNFNDNFLLERGIKRINVFSFYLVLSHPILTSKPDAHRMYDQDQVVIHTTRM